MFIDSWGEWDEREQPNGVKFRVLVNSTPKFDEVRNNFPKEDTKFWDEIMKDRLLQMLDDPDIVQKIKEKVKP